MLNISINIHAQGDSNPTFKVIRQEATGSLLLKIESEGLYPSVNVFLDADTLGALQAAVQTYVSSAQFEDA